jgi:hypothetical protein
MIAIAVCTLCFATISMTASAQQVYGTSVYIQGPYGGTIYYGSGYPYYPTFNYYYPVAYPVYAYRPYYPFYRAYYPPYRYGYQYGYPYNWQRRDGRPRYYR